jgi:hypothetical protein
VISDKYIQINMKRKAQAAMEYLMTYGWAILIVIIVAAALYALGVFDPATWTGTRTTGFANIGSPTDWIYEASGEFNITLKNAVGTPITISAVTAECGVADAPVILNTTAASWTIGSGSTIEFWTDAANCITLTAGSSYSTGLTVTYTKSGGAYTQQDTGTVTGSSV